MASVLSAIVTINPGYLPSSLFVFRNKEYTLLISLKCNQWNKQTWMYNVLGYDKDVFRCQHKEEVFNGEGFWKRLC